MAVAVDQKTYDAGYAALLDVFEAVIASAEAELPQRSVAVAIARPSPPQWDEEYAEVAISDCLDRMASAGPGQQRPNESLVARYRELADRAAPFLYG